MASVAVGLEYKPSLPVIKQHVWQRMAAGCITKVIITYKKVTDGECYSVLYWITQSIV